jgi:hypothetical protein
VRDALHDASKQPDAKPNGARDDDEHAGSDPCRVHDARTLRWAAMKMGSEPRLSSHPGPATESQHIRNDDPWWDSAASSFLSSHDDIIGAQKSPLQQACGRTRIFGSPRKLAADTTMSKKVVGRAPEGLGLQKSPSSGAAVK